MSDMCAVRAPGADQSVEGFAKARLTKKKIKPDLSIEIEQPVP